MTVAGRIAPARVRLGLDDAARSTAVCVVMHEHAAEQPRRECHRPEIERWQLSWYSAADASHRVHDSPVVDCDGNERAPSLAADTPPFRYTQMDAWTPLEGTSPL